MGAFLKIATYRTHNRRPPTKQVLSAGQFRSMTIEILFLVATESVASNQQWQKMPAGQWYRLVGHFCLRSVIIEQDDQLIGR
ncbi:unnamed protein product [Anisakis simplex]|uniref:Transposase n=1 Tax=Anisakis simplex TaxID=6269 RepID=A0A0M3JY32_ANISI|nr:unnamed protein product [Anisakis simplex]